MGRTPEQRLRARGEAVRHLSKELADRSDRPVSYRESAGSTGVRVDRTIGAETDPDDAGESSPKPEERGKTHG